MIGYLLDPAIQVQDENGVTITGARLYVYNSNTSDLAETYKDFDGTRNTNPVITDTLGNCTIIAEDGIAYDIVFKDAHDNLLFTKQNITVKQGGSGTGNVQVVAGYGIDVDSTVSAGIRKYEVAIDPTIVETVENITKYEAGDNIVLTNLPNNEKAINLANEVVLSDNNYQSKLNSEQNTFVNTSANKASIQDASGFYASNMSQTTYTEVGYDHIVSTNSSATIDWQLGNKEITISSNSGNGDYGKLHLGLDDVSLEERHTFSPDKVYSLTGACISAQSALTAVMSGDMTPYSGGTGISVSNHQISCNGDITPYSGGTGISISNHQISCNGDITPYSGGTNITVNNHQISCTGDMTPYSAGDNINITNHVISGKDWASTFNDIVYADPLVLGKSNTVTNTRNPNVDYLDEIYGHYNNINGYHNCIHGLNNFIDGTNIYIFGQNNGMSATTNGTPCSVCIGERNKIETSNGGTFLIGNDLSGDNNSYNKIKIGFANNYLEINGDGTFYKVINGNRTQI